MTPARRSARRAWRTFLSLLASGRGDEGVRVLARAHRHPPVRAPKGLEVVG